MSGPWHPTGRAPVSSRFPQAQGTCDRCGGHYALRSLKWQYQFAGVQLQNLRLLVCDRCLDVPQMQLKTIVLPPDPVPVFNPRPEIYVAEVPSYISTLEGVHLVTMGGDNLVTMIRVTPSPDPDNPYYYAEP
jgi:hypothetical protein